MQRLFRLLIFLNQPYMFRATNSPISTVARVGSSVGALYQKLYIQSKGLLRMGEIVARNM